MTLRSLRPADFAAFFAAVHGVQPFPWQDRLLHQVVDQGKWPQVLDLPTGTGKTAAIDSAVFHLALEASRGSERRAPVRIAYVVDRRLIVDDTYGRAYKLQMALAQSTDPIVAAVASALRSLAGDHHQPALLVRRLRGGAPREDDWARTPVQPTILCSTVDQVGSRLLFRGYGISDRMKPVQAGLLGSDCLLLLDEAHLAEPFRQMLQAMKHLRGADHAPWDVALLTATPGTGHEAQFHLEAADRVHPTLSSRLKVPKRAALIELRAKRGYTEPENRIEAIAEQAKAAVQRLSTTIRHPAVGVVVNRVARARAVFERLEQELPEAQVMLVIGPARAIDREQLAMTQLQPIRTGAERSLSRPFVVVATQTIEAGVDIDFDGLITEAAALDALRQRFGRLNRAGRPVAAEAVIVAHLEEVGPKADDPVYGDRIAKTWEALKGVANEASVDFGIERRAFSIAITACAAKFCNSAISFCEKGRTS